MRRLLGKIALIPVAIALFAGIVSCVDENRLLGYGIVPIEETFVTRTVTIPIEEMYLATIDSLMGYNEYRMVLGSITDTTYGTMRHGACVALVPLTDTVNWGHNVRVRSFQFTAAVDSLSYLGRNNASIIQHIRVYPMYRAIDSTLRYSCDIKNKDFTGTQAISLGVPTYNGGDSLSFYFTKEFAQTYIPQEAFTSSEDVVETFTVDSIDVYKRRHKGIYICTDDNLGLGGRTNFFKTDLQYDDDYYIVGNYAALNITADYGTRTNVDTTLIFCFTPTAFNDEGSYYSFNTCETEYIAGKQYGEPTSLHGKPAFKVLDKMNIEGGVGYKPVIRASYLRKVIAQSVVDTLRRYGYDSVTFDTQFKHVVINKATLTMFYDVPQDYDNLTFYPQVLNPTLRINNEKKDTVVYLSLADASISSENQGDVDKYNCCYKPDLTHHVMKILASTAEDESKELTQKDIWFLILANETVAVSSDASSNSDYYQQMAYLNYYNSLLNGSSSGYDSYSNYYNYYMMQQYYSSLSSGDETTTIQALDTDRYYNAVLRGPKAGKRAPKLEITYSFLRNDK